MFFLGIFTGRSKGDGQLGLVFRLTDSTYMLLYKDQPSPVNKRKAILILSIFPEEIKVMVILANVNFKSQ